MSISRKKLAVVSLLGIGALGLVGVGAGASFTDSVSATQRINTGTLSMAISSDAGGTVNGKSLTYKLENSGSKIDEKHTVTVTNTGSLPLVLSSVSVHPDGANDQPLAEDIAVDLAGNVMSVQAAQTTGWTCAGADCTLAPNGGFQLLVRLHRGPEQPRPGPDDHADHHYWRQRGGPLGRNPVPHHRSDRDRPGQLNQVPIGVLGGGTVPPPRTHRPAIAQPRKRARRAVQCQRHRPRSRV